MINQMRNLLGVGALALAMAAVGCTQQAAMPTPVAAMPAATRTAAPATEPTVSAAAIAGEGLTFAGNVQTRQQVAIVPKVGGRVIKLGVDVGSVVKAGDVLVELDRDAASAQVAQAEAALAGAQARLAGVEAGPRAEQITQAEANLTSARARLAGLEQGGRSEQVAQAEANLASAQARLEQTKKGATSFELESARLAIEQAKDSLYGAQSSRDSICGSPYMPKAQCDIAKSQVAATETAVNAAQNRFEQAKAGATAEQMVQVEAAVKVAEQQVALAKQPATENDLRQVRAAVSGAEAQLALVKQPVTEFDLKSARAGVDQAKAAVELVKVQLTETIVKAPFDGVVSARMTSEGAIAGPTAPLLTLISAQNEIVINVDEANLGKVQKSQAATVEVTAYPGTSFKAKVTNIAPSVDARSRTTVVKLVAEDAEGKLRDGMFAQVRLAVAGN